MKKLFTLLLTLSFAFGLMACSDVNKEADNEVTAPTVTEFTAEADANYENVLYPIFTIKFNNPDEVRISQITIDGNEATIINSEQTSSDGVTTVIIENVVNSQHIELTQDRTYKLESFKWYQDSVESSVTVTDKTWTYEAQSE